jgi:hypothetical protein
MSVQALKQIEISDSTFQRLQKLAKPLVDTTDSVIALLIDYYEKHKFTSAMESNFAPQYPTKTFDCGDAPNLTHTKLVNAKVNGNALGNKNNWNKLLSEVVILTAGHCKTEEDLRRAIIVNFVKGRKEDNGYHFLPKVNLSIQGQSAGDAWKAIWHIVKRFDISIEVDFVWHNKPEAAFPGEAGRLIWK